MALTKYPKDTAVLVNVGTNPEDRTDLTDETFKAKWDENATDWKTFYNDTATVEIDALITAIKGAGWTSESLKGLADLISTLSNNFNTYTTETVHYANYVTRDISTAGTQTVTGLPFAAKKVTFRVNINGAATMSSGVSVDTTSHQVHGQDSSGVTYSYADYSIFLQLSGSWTVKGKITAITSTSFTITWTIVSGTPSGTAIILFDADKH